MKFFNSLIEKIKFFRALIADSLAVIVLCQRFCSDLLNFLFGVLIKKSKYLRALIAGCLAVIAVCQRFCSDLLQFQFGGLIDKIKYLRALIAGCLAVIAVCQRFCSDLLKFYFGVNAPQALSAVVLVIQLWQLLLSSQFGVYEGLSLTLVRIQIYNLFKAP